MKPEDIPTKNNPIEYIKYKEYLMQNLIDIFKKKESSTIYEKNEKILIQHFIEMLEIYKSV